MIGIITKSCIHVSTERTVPVVIQKIMTDRAAKFGNIPEERYKYKNRYVFSGKIICGNCGAVFKRRTWLLTNK